MIAIDASTAVQSFRDGAYDVAELGGKLQALLEGAQYVSFKYADGSVVSLPAAALVHAMAPAFARLLIGGQVSLGVEGGALLVGPVGSDGALEALVPAHAAERASISGSHIVGLTVSGSLSIGDLSDWVAAHGLARKTIVAERISGAVSAEATVASGIPGAGLSAYVNGGASLGRATFQGEWATSPLSSAFGLLTPNTVGLYDDFSQGAVEIRLDSGTMSIRGASAVTMAIRCEVPYYGDAGWESLEVDSYNVDRGDASHIEAARGAMSKFLLWPSWKVEGAATPGGSYPTRAFRVCPGPTSEEGPVIRVENASNGSLELPHVWAFTKGSDGKGAVAVVATVKLPPYSCKEFKFHHSASTNYGYMYPLSLWY